MGLVYPNRAAAPGPAAPGWPQEFSTAGFWLTSWELLGQAVLGVVQRDLWRVLAPMGALLLLTLWLAFRRWREVCLSIAVLLFSGGCLWTTMRLAGWSWNLLNLMALPLLLGAGVDYSIHIQLALRRHGGDLGQTWRRLGRALLLCAATTGAGFGSLAWSNNAGLASLGQVCAAGIACAFLTSVVLLPGWWKAIHVPRAGRERFPQTAPARPAEGPSALYQARLWRCAILLTRTVGVRLARGLARLGADAYWRFHRRRREIVEENLLPVLAGDRAAARKASRRLFQNFAMKLVDLWRYEGGQPLEGLFHEAENWERFVTAQARGRGVLLLTPHLGNWEFGAPLLAQRGVKLQVLTLAEPDARLTALRREARARWGIETLVIGGDPFAFVEVIRRLEAGAVVALLVDRPPAASAVEVELFGRPFAASLAAAELARATGCVLLPVVLPRREHGYSAGVLPEIDYDRAALGKREARRELTQEIMRAFEPVIRQHPAQWFHFVPLWPADRERP